MRSHTLTLNYNLLEGLLFTGLAARLAMRLAMRLLRVWRMRSTMRSAKQNYTMAWFISEGLWRILSRRAQWGQHPTIGASTEAGSFQLFSLR